MADMAVPIAVDCISAAGPDTENDAFAAAVGALDCSTCWVVPNPDNDLQSSIAGT